MQNPVELIYLLSQTTDRLFLWTHYFDHDIINNNIEAISQNLHYRDGFTGTMSLEYKGFNCILYRQEYKASLDNPGFCVGRNSFSYWMSREDVISCFNYLAMKILKLD